MQNLERRVNKPRCFLVYALAPEGFSAAEANRIFNAFIADRSLPLVIFHDHFIGQPGGVAIFFVDGPRQQTALFEQTHLQGWQVEYRPLIFAHNPAAFDEQIAFTLKHYRDKDWEEVQREKRPVYGNPAREAATAQEETD